MNRLGIFKFLEMIGFSEVKSIFGSNSLALPAIIAIDTWEWTPLIMMIVLAGLVTIPNELIEAASIDGASMWQRVRYIMLPLLKSTFIVAILIRTMDLVRFFTIIFVTTGGGPADLTKILAIRIHENAFRFYKLGYASTLGISLLAVTILLGSIFIRAISRREG
jgi:multiple sugar transport system permease protein